MLIWAGLESESVVMLKSDCLIGLQSAGGIIKPAKVVEGCGLTRNWQGQGFRDFA